MTHHLPTEERFDDPYGEDRVEEFEPDDQADPEEPESILDESDDVPPAWAEEADSVDVVEQSIDVEGDDDYERED